MKLSFFLAALCGLGTGAFPALDKLATSPWGLSSRDSDDDFNPDDLSFIKKFAAVGDSYSAGIGAGNKLGGLADWACSRYDHAYPNLMNEDERLGDPKNREFQFHSCSGAVIQEVIDDQLPHVSSGGNDAELVNILNQCIFQWSAIDVNLMDQAVLKNLKSEPWAAGIYWENIGRGCAKQLSISRDILESDEFAQSLDSVISATKKKLSNTGMLYYTGYAKFFGTDLDPACDDVTWSIWSFKSTPTFFLKKQLLTTDSRKQMNDLVELANKKLAAAVERAGSQVEFVNYDEYVGMFHGRYCEPGVDESTVESNTRTGLMFYELNTKDPFGSNRGSEAPKNTKTAHGNLLARITEYIDPDATLALEDYIDEESAKAMQAASLDTLLGHQNANVVPNILPDGYGRIFHPQILLHEIIAKLILWRVSSRLEQQHGWEKIPEIDDTQPTCPVTPGGDVVLHYKQLEPGTQIKENTKLRILGVGDSITLGARSEWNGGDGDGYRRQLKNDLSQDKVIFAGTETSGTMAGGYYAAWSGMTIQYINDHVDPSLEQRPNIVLLAAGTNDMNPSGSISTEGNDPKGAADRLGKLIDKIVNKCPDATVLVAMIIDTCDPNQSPRTKEFQKLIPDVVRRRSDSGAHVLAADFTTFGTDLLVDCIHPTLDGYKLMGDYWYSFIGQIPSSWIKDPVGDDPPGRDGTDSNANGGIDENIPAPDWGTSPIRVTSKEFIKEAVNISYPPKTRYTRCKGSTSWKLVGKIAEGLGSNGDWQYNKWWMSAGKVAAGLGLENAYVRLHDMNGDGKADYVWIHPVTGEIHCWINNLPEPWYPAGNNHGIIGRGAGPAKTDMNGDGMEDYLVVNPDTGSVHVYWNYGPDDSWYNGWKFVDGGEIASGVPHANLETLRFPDINGDGRADYVYIGKGGVLKHHLNLGSVGGQDVLFYAQGGIATGAVDDISKLIFADMNGDGRDDYLIWDNDGGLTGYLNQRTNSEGVPMYIYQGPAKTIADGIGQNPDTIRLADMDGDGKDDYVHVGDEGALYVWYNGGTTDDSMGIDGLRFARTSAGDAYNYVWLDPKTGAPTIYMNGEYYVSDKEPLGWSWTAHNKGRPVAAGAAPAKQVQFGDINGDGYDDYLTLDPVTGALKAYLWVPEGGGEDKYGGILYNPIGTIATGLGPGKNVRIADIDGDGRDDYIYLSKIGGATVYRNVYGPDTGPEDRYRALPQADASGIGQRPEEISFHDINGDGKADYVWTRPLDGRVQVWLNMYPELPAWKGIGTIAEGVGTSGANVRFTQLLYGGHADYLAVNPSTAALGAWFNTCDPDTATKKYRVTVTEVEHEDGSWAWAIYEHEAYSTDPPDYCSVKANDVQRIDEYKLVVSPPSLSKFEAYGHACFYRGRLICEGVYGTRCTLSHPYDEGLECESGAKYSSKMTCEWY